MPTPPSAPTSAELFCGAGGLALGAHRAGLTPQAQFERCPRAHATLSRAAQQRGWPAPVLTDVRDISYQEYPRPTVVLGGPPCQPFSRGGLAQAQLDPRDGFPEAVRAVRELKPEAFIFENVPGLTRHRAYFQYVLHQLSRPSVIPPNTELTHHLEELESRPEEYSVHWVKLQAADFGVPQRRERIFIIGLRGQNRIWTPPVPTHARHPTGTQRPWVPLSQVLERHPLGPDPLDHAPTGARSYPGHTGSPINQPAKTLKAGVNGVPGGENMARYPDGTLQYFSARQAAALQGFPPNWPWPTTWTHALKQIGNAVPVPLAEAVTRSVLHTLGALHDQNAATSP